MTSAIEILRRLLDERGVEYRVSATGYSIDIGPSITAYANRTDTTLDVSLRGFTPEQAVEATLGRGTCRMEHLWSDDVDGACWWCKVCDKPAFTHGDFPPNYCPNCGRKVEP